MLYALSLLEDVSPSLWFSEAQPLIQHASPKVRALALERLAALPRTTISARFASVSKILSSGAR